MNRIERQLKRVGARRTEVNMENRVRQRTSATLTDMVDKKKTPNPGNPAGSEEFFSGYSKN